MKVSPHLTGRLLGKAARAARRIDYALLYQRFSAYTMVKPPAFRHNLELARAFRGAPGLVVECGVWRGGMSAALATVLGPERSYYLFDSFEGLPPPREIDGAAARAWSSGADPESFHDNCRADQESAAEAMRLAGAKNATLIKGWFDQTLPEFQPQEPIAILRLDGDWYDSTMCCFTHLFDKVRPGGVIIIDDYLIWEGCTRAVHDFLAARQRPEPIRQFDNALAYLVKQ